MASKAASFIIEHAACYSYITLLPSRTEINIYIHNSTHCIVLFALTVRVGRSKDFMSASLV
jgi:hypothetical protein